MDLYSLKPCRSACRIDSQEANQKQNLFLFKKNNLINLPWEGAKQPRWDGHPTIHFSMNPEQNEDHNVAVDAVNQ